jgi:tryptophan synthase beta chain
MAALSGNFRQELHSMDLFDFPEGREGYYGAYGGAFLPEILHSTIEELREGFRACKKDPAFWREYRELLQEYSGRPTPVTYLANLSQQLGGARIFVKREDLNHTGSHKINNVMGQGLLCKRLGKTRVIAETGAGQHGFATATMAAKFGFRCRIYMGAVDIARQRPNVFWMENLGSEVVSVEDGQRTLKDAINEALRDWVTNMANTHYVLGTACGRAPLSRNGELFPVDHRSSRRASRYVAVCRSSLPDRIYACVGGGSNAIGMFQGFLNDDERVELVACEAGGHGPGSGLHAARLAYDGCLGGCRPGHEDILSCRIRQRQYAGNPLHGRRPRLHWRQSRYWFWLWEHGRVRFDRRH